MSVKGNHPNYCFTFRNQPIKTAVTNNAWYAAVEKAGLDDLRFHDLRHTWASWHRQAGTSCDELKDLVGWKSRSMVDRYAKFATEHLTIAASRIEFGHSKRDGFGHVYVTQAEAIIVSFFTRPRFHWRFEHRNHLKHLPN